MHLEYWLAFSFLIWNLKILPIIMVKTSPVEIKIYFSLISSMDLNLGVILKITPLKWNYL